jgi:hypothetical protein
MISNVFHTHALVGAEKPARKGAWGLAHLAVCLSGWFLPLNHRLADGMGGVGGGGGKHADSEVYVCALVRLCKPSLGHQEQSLSEGQDSFARAWMWRALFCVTVQGFPGKTQAAALMSTMRVLGRWQRLWPHTPDLFFWTNNLTFKVA